MNKKIFALLIFCAPLAHAKDFSSYFLLESFSHSEAMAIKAVADDEWNETLHGGDVAFTTDRIELGIGWKQWRLGVFRRYDYFYQFTPDTAYLKYSAENRLDLPVGQQMDIYLSANTVIANGLSLAYTHSIDSANFSVKVSYLNGKNLTSGSLAGQAVAVADNDYDLNFDVDYYYSEDKLFDREVTGPGGEGFAIDVLLDWDYEQWNFKLDIKDLLARIYWRDTPRTIATGNTDTKDFDADGYLIFNPVISGLETNQDYTQTLPRKINFTSAYNWNNYLMLFEFHDFEIKQFYSIGAGLNKNKFERMAFFYNITAHALKLDYRNQGLVFSFTSDEVQLRKARTFALQLSLVVEF